ncbi:MAG: N-6 DNA methylase, partial [Cytophagaceae bacterium]
GMVDCMVSMPSNMFFTVTLPATLWFFDKKKINSNRKDKILFIDARNVYHQIDRAHREWKEEHIQNMTAIVRLYRGENHRYLELVNHYSQKAGEAIQDIPAVFSAYQEKLKKSLENLKKYASESKDKRKPEEQKKLDKSGLLEKLNKLVLTECALQKIQAEKEIPVENQEQIAYAEKLKSYIKALTQLDEILKANKDVVSEIWTEADKLLKVKNDKNWTELELNSLAKFLDELQQNWKTATEQVNYWYENIDWLQSRFPVAEYTDVTGLCKVADKAEYAEEQDYSLNAGRYVGVEIEEATISSEEFKERLKSLEEKLERYSLKSREIESQIFNNIKSLL